MNASPRLSRSGFKRLLRPQPGDWAASRKAARVSAQELEKKMTAPKQAKNVRGQLNVPRERKACELILRRPRHNGLMSQNILAGWSRAEIECSRCLAPVDFPLQIRHDLYHLLKWRRRSKKHIAHSPVISFQFSQPEFRRC